MMTLTELKEPVAPGIIYPGQESDKTGKTDLLLSNAEFLTQIFGRSAEYPPMIVSFAGNPRQAGAAAWHAAPWDPEHPAPPEHNNFFALSTFRTGEDGQRRRRKAHFVALHAIMLNDIGSKVDPGRLPLPPSWQIETSAGNFQLGYILAEPLTDGALADRLMRAVIAAGLSDPGAGGPQCRLARLPEGINGKSTPPFVCRAVVWAPERRYTVQQLIDGLQLDMHSVTRTGKGSTASGRSAGMPAGAETVFTLPAENPVIAALRSQGLYKAPLGNCKHDITCPWVDEHTGGADQGTAYFEPTEEWPVGGFKCLHSHGDRHRIGDLLAFLNVPASAARMKPVIRIVPGEIGRIVDAAEFSLSRTGQYFQRGGLIVSVLTDPGTQEASVQPVSQGSLLRGIAEAASWEKYDRSSGEWVSCDPPVRHTAILYDSARYAHLPVLAGLARQPFLRSDGTLCATAGYDRQSGLYGAFSAQDFTVAEAPSRKDALDALADLSDLLREFPFANESDRSAALCAILTATVRANLPTAPMFHVRAPQISTGKSYLCELITVFATAQHNTPTSFPADDEECRKLLLAELLQAPAVIEFDNLTTDLLPHKSLCTALTSQQIEGRILGTSRTAKVGTRTLFLSSGNNVGPVADMTRRCVTIHLDPGCESPATRTFARPNLVHEAHSSRGRLVSVALTIIRAYLAAGSPKADCKPLASYTQWGEWCRQPLLWLGLPDPAASVFEGMDEDPERELLGRLLTVWDRLFGKQPTMVRHLRNSLMVSSPDADDLREVLEEVAGDRDGINSRRLGRWIKRHAGRIVHGMRLVRVPGRLNAETWRVESVISVPSIDSS